jgi:hypothetical protein
MSLQRIREMTDATFGVRPLLFLMDDCSMGRILMTARWLTGSLARRVCSAHCWNEVQLASSQRLTSR